MAYYTITNTDNLKIVISLTDDEVEAIPNLDEGEKLDLANGGNITRQTDDDEYYYNKDNKNNFFDRDTFNAAIEPQDSSD
ncbi:hypothetical protein [Thalassospira tepidiphila]|uniref:Uncharacterized protein n=2 Tax=Thalassospira tepidiphila TaxID=393657 RepID=A0A853KUM6_9PROT|nr:hypothetical protein [Thalassospira tepidiphila]NJB76697.1 hypothetical protein [Thalassospira tepidiphila]OAZ07835.1 hypothetical protein TH4_19740 [Thalassospira tepidiphila MCCC 1A03514]